MNQLIQRCFCFTHELLAPVDSDQECDATAAGSSGNPILQTGCVRERTVQDEAASPDANDFSNQRGIAQHDNAGRHRAPNSLTTCDATTLVCAKYLQTAASERATAASANNSKDRDENSDDDGVIVLGSGSTMAATQATAVILREALVAQAEQGGTISNQITQTTTVPCQYYNRTSADVWNRFNSGNSGCRSVSTTGFTSLKKILNIVDHVNVRTADVLFHEFARSIANESPGTQLLDIRSFEVMSLQDLWERQSQGLLPVKRPAVVDGTSAPHPTWTSIEVSVPQRAPNNQA